MPAKSKRQQQAAGAALAAKRGKSRVRDLQGASKSMYRSMSERKLREMARAKRRTLPSQSRRKNVASRAR